MAANESTKYTHFSNVEVGTSAGGGGFKVGGLQQNLGKAQTVTGALTLTNADNGKTLYLNAAAGATIVLPAVEAGLHFTFVVASSFATTNWVIDSAEGDNIDGVLDVAGAVVRAEVEDQINFVATAEALGDYVVLHSDGVQWFVYGQGAITGGITASDPS